MGDKSHVHGKKTKFSWLIFYVSLLYATNIYIFMGEIHFNGNIVQNWLLRLQFLMIIRTPMEPSYHSVSDILWNIKCILDVEYIHVENSYFLGHSYNVLSLSPTMSYLVGGIKHMKTVFEPRNIWWLRIALMIVVVGVFFSHSWFALGQRGWLNAATSIETLQNMDNQLL